MDQWDLNVAPSGVSIEGGLFSEMYARLGDVFTPQAAARTFAEMVAGEPRIVVRYDERPLRVETERVTDGRRITAVTFANVTSQVETTLAAPLVVDATDFADVAALAGARYDVGRQDTGLDERMQAVTLMFTVADVDWHALAATYDDERFGPGGVVNRRAWGYSDLLRAYRPLAPTVLVRDLNLGLLQDGSLTVNAIDVTGIDGLDPAELENARRLSEGEAYRLVAYLRSSTRIRACARCRFRTGSLRARDAPHRRPRALDGGGCLARPRSGGQHRTRFISDRSASGRCDGRARVRTGTACVRNSVRNARAGGVDELGLGRPRHLGNPSRIGQRPRHSDHDRRRRSCGHGGCVRAAKRLRFRRTRNASRARCALTRRSRFGRRSSRKAGAPTHRTRLR